MLLHKGEELTFRFSFAALCVQALGYCYPATALGSYSKKKKKESSNRKYTYLKKTLATQSAPKKMKEGNGI
jgi:hypothetical protein